MEEIAKKTFVTVPEPPAEPTVEPSILKKYYDIQNRLLGAVNPAYGAAQNVLVGGAKALGENIYEGVKQIPDAVADKARFIATGQQAQPAQPVKDPYNPANVQTETPLAKGDVSYAQQQPQDTTAQPQGSLGMQGIAQKFGAEAEGLALQAKEYERIIQEREKIAKTQQEQYEAMKGRVEDFNNKMNKSYEDFAKKNISIDNYWAEKGTGGKILAGLAVIFGGIGQAQGQNTNIGLDVINAAIDRDLQIQKANIEKDKAGMEFQKGILADNIRLFGDVDQALIASKMTMLQGIDDKIKQIGLSSTGKAKVGEMKIAQDALQQEYQKLNLAAQAALAKGGAGLGVQKAQSDVASYFDEIKKINSLTDVTSEYKRGKKARLIALIKANLAKTTLKGVSPRSDAYKSFMKSVNVSRLFDDNKEVEEMKQNFINSMSNTGVGEEQVPEPEEGI